MFLVPFFFYSTPTFAYSASITTASSITTDIAPNNSGNTNAVVKSEDINIVTNCRAGYNLTISGPSDENLYLNGNSSNNTSGQYFSPVDGTSTLISTPNKWGYSLTADEDTDVFTPLTSTETYLKTTSETASQTDIDDTFPIYYGVSMANSMSPGTYTFSNNNTIVYQLTIDDTCRGYTVEFDANGGFGIMDNQDINIDTPTNLSAENFIAPDIGSYTDAEGHIISGTSYTYWSFNG
ncbi:hypothetical protein IIY24_02060, partial [Candidatus Saccharibacteria bacterium]|nr:hypothetical protein [Candidatus Saccharibacteria bacterium]